MTLEPDGSELESPTAEPDDSKQNHELYNQMIHE